MTEMMMLKLGLVLLGLAVSSAAAGPGSCQGRCGELFLRGQQCSCDMGCLQHGECCTDFQDTCTSAQSCLGRCGEAFKRGQLCECDPACIRFNTCCHDYQQQCDASAMVSHPGNSQSRLATASRNQKSRKSGKGRKKSNSESEELYAGRGHSDSFGLQNPLTDGYSGPAQPAVPNQLQHGGNVNFPSPDLSLPGNPSTPGAADNKMNMKRVMSRQGAGPAGKGLSDSFGLQNPLTDGYSGPAYPAVPNPFQHGGNVHVPSRDLSLPSIALTLGSGASGNPLTPGAADGKLNVELIISPEGAGPAGPTYGVKMDIGAVSDILQDIKQAVGLPVGQEGSELLDSGFLADLCSDSPIIGLVVLSNGSILIFKGDKFWSVDPVSRSAGLPQSITDILGVPSPIDAVFTRPNCNKNIYIIKGDQIWALGENLMLQPSYPKPLSSEFPGLTGTIKAALVVPATKSTPETIYFFKTGDVMQKFTYPRGGSASCKAKPKGKASSLKKLTDRLKDVLLGGDINIKVSLKGFPTPVTSALTVPSPPGGDGYQFFVFVGPLVFRVQISGDLPALANPDAYDGFSPLPLYDPAAAPADPASLAGQNRDSPYPANDSPYPANDSPYPANSIKFWLRCP